MRMDEYADLLEDYTGKQDWQNSAVGKLMQWIRSGQSEQLYRMNAYQLADELEVNRQALLELLLEFTQGGFVDIYWDYHCPYCHGIADSHNHLEEATASSYCQMCKVDFVNTMDTSVEVTFLPAEKYVTISDDYVMEKKQDMMKMIQEKKLRMPDPHVTGLDCMHVPRFRDIFEDDVLSYNESLAIKNVAILFTDIKGSTAMYEQLGDARAYRVVRDHFDIMFKIIPEFGGVVVKTIGDSIMASFISAKSGVEAAIAIDHAFSEYNSGGLRDQEIVVKMGLHAGPTIMVNLNKRLDYFGKVVNLAARIQTQAQENHILISDDVRNDPEVIAALRPYVKSLLRREVPLRGIVGTQRLYRLKLNEAQTTDETA
jgi:class 3 adenylate cyclase